MKQVNGSPSSILNSASLIEQVDLPVQPSPPPPILAELKQSTASPTKPVTVATCIPPSQIVPYVRTKTLSEKAKLVYEIVTPWLNYYDTLKLQQSSYLIEDYVLQTYTSAFPVRPTTDFKEKHEAIQLVLTRLRSLSKLYGKSNPTAEQMDWIKLYERQLRYAPLCIFVPILHTNTLRDWCNGYEALESELKTITNNETNITITKDPAFLSVVPAQPPPPSTGSPICSDEKMQVLVDVTTVPVTTKKKKRKRVNWMDSANELKKEEDEEVKLQDQTYKLIKHNDTVVPVAIDHCSLYMNKRYRLESAKTHLLKYQSYVLEIQQKLEFTLNDRIPFWTTQVDTLTKEYQDALVQLKQSLDSETNSS